MSIFKNILAKTSLLCLCFSLLISPTATSAQSGSGAKLSFSPSDGDIYVGEEFEVKMTIDTNGELVDAVDSFFSYDSSLMEIISLTPGSAFQAYPGQQFNNPPGIVKITGFSVLNPFTGTGDVATIKFRALQPTNNAQLTYDFTLQDPPLTTDSNIARTVVSDDILKEVKNASFDFLPDNHSPYVDNLNPSPSTGAPRNTNISFNIKDDERGVNIDTVRVKINDVTYTTDSNQFEYSGDEKNYHIIINPTSDFDYGEQIPVSINSADINGNEMSPSNYSFRINNVPPSPNIAPQIVEISPLADSKNSLLQIKANDEDAPNSDLTLTVSGVPASTPFTDNGDGTGLLDYTNLEPGNYFVSFTATDQGSPSLSGSDGTWIIVGGTTTQTVTTSLPSSTEVNHPPKFKSVAPIEVALPSKLNTKETPKEVTINIEANDSDRDPLNLSVRAPEMNNFTFIDLGRGTGTLHWTPEKPGVYSAIFRAEDDGNPTLSDTLVVTILVTGENVCPTPTTNVESGQTSTETEKTVFICPTKDEQIADEIAEKISPTLTTTREEAVVFLVKNLDLEKTKANKFDRCKNNYNECLSIFKINSSYEDLKISNKGIESLFPDYADIKPQNRHAIEIATIDGFVTGYYNNSQSPFKPQRAVTRIEALTMMLRAADVIPTLYREELVAILGGEEELKKQQSSFKDIDPTQEDHWWYVVPTNAAIEHGIIDRATNFHPNEFITEDDFLEMFNRLKKYLDESKHFEAINTDSDFDGLTDQNEINIFGTDYLSPDTDSDTITDYEELIVYKTNPNIADTDNDGLDDFLELNETNTDPLNRDTDGDGFTDGFENKESATDPKDSGSFPEDRNKNGVDDNWEKDHKVFKASLQEATRDGDTDGDGLSNALEFNYNTDPQNPDSDSDGLSDSQEVLLYKTDPNTPSTEEKIKLRFTNIQDGQLVSNRNLTLQGYAPLGEEVSIVIRNEFHEKILGTAVADENNIFVFQVPIELQDGEYYLIYKILDTGNKKVDPSEPVRIVVNSQTTVKPPKPKKLDHTTISEERLAQNLKIELKNNKPVLIGNTDVGNQVIAIWKSVVFTSALIADSATGEFEIQAPNPLPPGEHSVYVYAVRPGDQSISETIRIPFTVSADATTASIIDADGNKIEQTTETLFDSTSSAIPKDVLIAIFAILLIGFGVIAWRIFFRRDTKELQPPTKPKTPTTKKPNK